jgi:hypothetical protein
VAKVVVVMAAMGAATVGSVKVGVSWALAARVVAKASKGGGRAGGGGDGGGTCCTRRSSAVRSVSVTGAQLEKSKAHW